jgi:hypothetical protein
MKRFNQIITLIFCLAIAIPNVKTAQVYKFSGGPSGGTFQYYASAVSTLAKKIKYRVLASSSGGSIENVRTVNSGKSSFGVAYSGNVFDALKGKLVNDTKKYENVRTVSFFYGAPAQLIVKKKSGITSPKELIGKRVGIGNAGSGAAASAEIFFKAIGIWDKIDKDFLGYRAAADAFNNGQLDAFWIFAGFPNASVLEAALQSDVLLLDTYKIGKESGLFTENPYFNKVVIPANTYSGQDEPVNTFQDAALWITNANVPEDVVYSLLKKVYSEDGLKYMIEVHNSAKVMTIENGINGIVTPLHPGAEKFWKEKGLIK